MGVTRYLADKSALARLHLPPVADAIVPLMERGLVSICGVTDCSIHVASSVSSRPRRSCCWGLSTVSAWARFRWVRAVA